jgi:hypothetical protein
VQSTRSNPRVTIVCALEFERTLLRRSALAKSCDLQCCGPTARGVHAWSERAAPQGPVILAGLAGALAPNIRAGSVWCIREVIATDSALRWNPSVAFNEIPSANVASTSASVKSPPERHRLQQQTGADLVDLESVAFAQIATQRNWTWAIVRSVSDDSSTTLPADVDDWIDQKGRTRIGPILRSTLRSPRLIGTIFTLGRNSRLAMTSLARALHGALVSGQLAKSD